MRDRKGSFLRNPIFPSNVFNNNLNPRDSKNSSGPGIWSLRESDSDDSTGVANYDPFFNYVEFILKFEQQNGYQFPNSINRPYWFWHGEGFGKGGKDTGWGTLTNTRSRFGSRCYVIGSTSNTSSGDESLYMYGQTHFLASGPARHNFLNIGYNDFTFEGWIYLTSLNQGTGHIFIIYGNPPGTTTESSGVRLAYNSNGDGALRLTATNNHAGSVTSSTSVLSLNQWTHIAMVRKNGAVRVFVNGTNVIQSNNFNYAFSNSKIGMYSAPTGVSLGTSFADETRFTNGIARYWNNFTPPSTEFYVPNVSGNNGLVLPFDDNDQIDITNPVLKDVANKNVWVGTNGAIKSGAEGGLFANSLYSSSHASFFYLSPDNVPDTSDFNLSFRMKSMTANSNSRSPTTLVNNRPWNVDLNTYVSTNGIDDGGYLFNLNTIMSLALGGGGYSTKNGSWNQFKGSLSLNITSGGATASIIQTSINSILRDTWNHIHISRNGTTYRLFVNGILSGLSDHYRATILPSARWQALAFGNSIFVAVSGGDAASNIAASSTDGITWTSRTLPASVFWSDVVYGDKFVAIAGGGSWFGGSAGTGYTSSTPTSATSTDGITWTPRTMPSSERWSAVTYGNGRYVAISGGPTNSNVAAYSTDGINWTTSALPQSTTWTSITYGNGIFVAVSRNTIAATSPDGVTWTERTLPSTGSFTISNNSTGIPGGGWTSVCYGNNLFVLTCSGQGTLGTNVYATSIDGITWTSRTLPSVGWWTKTIYGDNRYLMLSQDAAGGGSSGRFNSYANNCLLSTDGLNWTNVITPGTNTNLYDNGRYGSPGRIGTGTYGNGVFVGSHKVNTPGIRDSWATTSWFSTNNVGTQGFISLPMSINKQYLMLGCNRSNLIDENTMAQSTDNLSSRFNGYLADISFTRSTGATTISVPTVTSQPPRILY